MKRLVLFGAAIFSIALLTIDDASAQRGRGGGGGVRMGGPGIGGARMAGPGIRMAGPGVRGAYIRGPGIGVRGPGIYRGAVGARWAGVGPGRWYGNRWYGNRWRGWGWGFPLAAAAVGLGAYGYYNDSCVAWDGYQWVNVCYAGYGGYGGGYGGYGYW